MLRWGIGFNSTISGITGSESTQFSLLAFNHRSNLETKNIIRHSLSYLCMMLYDSFTKLTENCRTDLDTCDGSMTVFSLTILYHLIS